jgi:hypothetical protein
LPGGKLIGLKRNGGNGHELPETGPAVREEYSRDGNGDGEILLPLAIIAQIGDER